MTANPRIEYLWDVLGSGGIGCFEDRWLGCMISGVLCVDELSSTTCRKSAAVYVKWIAGHLLNAVLVGEAMKTGT
ncbi:MAG TPA: hypothetical protein VFQ61_16560 [Polyangiaceae bacterium]|nr:hypothetical protein [Polyangiaceae bacterium]